MNGLRGRGERIHRCNERGYATVVVLALVVLMLLLMQWSNRALVQMKREIQLVEQRHARQMAFQAATNNAPSATLEERRDERP